MEPMMNDMERFELAEQMRSSRDNSEVEDENENDEEPEEECEECGHAVTLHEAKYGCDYEADEWVHGIANDVDGLVAVRCGCTAWTVEPVEPDEVVNPNKEGGTNS